MNLKKIMDNTCKMMEFILSKEIDLVYSYDANVEVIVGMSPSLNACW